MCVWESVLHIPHLPSFHPVQKQLRCHLWGPIQHYIALPAYIYREKIHTFYTNGWAVTEYPHTHMWIWRRYTLCQEVIWVEWVGDRGEESTHTMQELRTFFNLDLDRYRLCPILQGSHVKQKEWWKEWIRRREGNFLFSWVWLVKTAATTPLSYDDDWEAVMTAFQSVLDRLVQSNMTLIATG